MQTELVLELKRGHNLGKVNEEVELGSYLDSIVFESSEIEHFQHMQSAYGVNLMKERFGCGVGIYETEEEGRRISLLCLILTWMVMLRAKIVSCRAFSISNGFGSLKKWLLLFLPSVTREKR
jgi:hypothetical protein